MSKDAVDRLIVEKEDFSVKKTKRYYLYSLIPLLIGLVWFAVSLLTVNQLQTQKKSLGVQLGKLNDSIVNAKQLLISIKYVRDSLQLGYFFHHDKTLLQNSMEADIHLNILLKDSSIDRNVTIEYFKKTADQDRVWLAFRELGYGKMIARKPTDEYLAKAETNAIYFGNGVRLTDLKVISLVLIRAGFNLTTIEHDNIGENTVQIGTRLYKVGPHTFVPPNRPAISVSKIIQAKEIQDILY